MHAGTEVDASDAAVVVASHGKFEEETIARAVELGVPYVGLVASRARGAAVLDSLREEGASADELARVHTPAGLDIGAREPGEIALSILAEIVQQIPHVRPVFSVRDKADERFTVGLFLGSRAVIPQNWARRCRTGGVIAIMYATAHDFVGGQHGVRVEEVENVMVRYTFPR